jgi:hypothetical protein
MPARLDVTDIAILDLLLRSVTHHVESNERLLPELTRDTPVGSEA